MAELWGWACETVDECNNVLKRLAEKADDPDLIQVSLAVPELFHYNAEYDFLEDFEIAAYRKRIPVFIRRVLDLAD